MPLHAQHFREKRPINSTFFSTPYNLLILELEGESPGCSDDNFWT